MQDLFLEAGFEPPAAPKHYPISALIGRVEVKDVLSQQECNLNLKLIRKTNQFCKLRKLLQIRRFLKILKKHVYVEDVY